MSYEALDRYWGGTIQRLDFDLSAHRLLLFVEVLDAGTRTETEIEFGGIRQLEFSDVRNEAWAYAELTSIEVERTRDCGDLWSVEMHLWSSASILALTCDRIEIDGKPLVFVQ